MKNNFVRNIKIWLFQKVGKSQNKVVVAEENSCGNELKSLRKLAMVMSFNEIGPNWANWQIPPPICP